ncbi:MAG: Crp/Fnr family transcriptional regulator [Ferruginibacter sp.]|nr:Crp/Fnr family transcriptional regulator [Ferruginibacter sp.]
MEELLKFLNSIYPLQDNLKDYLTKNLKTKELNKKDYLLKKGHVSKDICFINKGLLRCFYLIDEKEVCSWFMKEGDVIVSVESFFKQTVSYEAIQALDNCILYYITYDELQFIFRNFMEFNFIGRVILQQYYTLSEQRLYSMRMQKAPDRYAYLMENHAELIQRVPSKFLASYLGITEVTLSNIKGNF